MRNPGDTHADSPTHSGDTGASSTSCDVDAACSTSCDDERALHESYDADGATGGRGEGRGDDGGGRPHRNFSRFRNIDVMRASEGSHPSNPATPAAVMRAVAESSNFSEAGKVDALRAKQPRNFSSISRVDVRRARTFFVSDLEAIASSATIDFISGEVHVTGSIDFTHGAGFTAKLDRQAVVVICAELHRCRDSHKAGQQSMATSCSPDRFADAPLGESKGLNGDETAIRNLDALSSASSKSAGAITSMFQALAALGDSSLVLRSELAMLSIAATQVHSNITEMPEEQSDPAPAPEPPIGDTKGWEVISHGRYLDRIQRHCSEMDVLLLGELHLVLRGIKHASWNPNGLDKECIKLLVANLWAAVDEYSHWAQRPEAPFSAPPVKRLVLKAISEALGWEQDKPGISTEPAFLEHACQSIRDRVEFANRLEQKCADLQHKLDEITWAQGRHDHLGAPKVGTLCEEPVARLNRHIQELNPTLVDCVATFAAVMASRLHHGIPEARIYDQFNKALEVFAGFEELHPEARFDGQPLEPPPPWYPSEEKEQIAKLKAERDELQSAVDKIIREREDLRTELSEFKRGVAESLGWDKGWDRECFPGTALRVIREYRENCERIALESEAWRKKSIEAGQARDHLLAQIRAAPADFVLQTEAAAVREAAGCDPDEEWEAVVASIHGIRKDRDIFGRCATYWMEKVEVVVKKCDFLQSEVNRMLEAEKHHEMTMTELKEATLQIFELRRHRDQLKAELEATGKTKSSGEAMGTMEPIIPTQYESLRFCLQLSDGEPVGHVRNVGQALEAISQWPNGKAAVDQIRKAFERTPWEQSWRGSGDGFHLLKKAFLLGGLPPEGGAQ